MTNSWTGGQYSLVRMLFGAYFCLFFAHLVPMGAELFSNVGVAPDRTASLLYPYFPNLLFLIDSPVAVRSLLTVAAAIGLALGLGFQDRFAALALLYFGACLVTRNPGAFDPSVAILACLLFLHAALPTSPFGSWEARGRIDPDSGWRMPDGIFATAWIVMAVSYVGDGVLRWMSSSSQPETLTDAPASFIPDLVWAVIVAELLFAPLAMVPRLRPWLWLVSFSVHAIHAGAFGAFGASALSSAMLLVHLFTFDPGWIPGRRHTVRLTPRHATHSIVFYDGACGLCHRTIRFLLAEDGAGTRFRFAPLDTELFRTTCAITGSGFDQGEPIPDSVLVHRPGQPMLTRAAGVLELGQELGGIWRILATLLSCLPLAVLNTGYDFIASVRHRLFARVENACPILPADLQERFAK